MMRRRIAIELCVWRSGRIGGSSRAIGSVQLRNARREGLTDGRGDKLEEFKPREVRSPILGAYEMPYEIQGLTIFVLRFWHTREHR